MPCKILQLVFSSSATVYGQPKVVPCTEDFPLSTMNPYGRTKVVNFICCCTDLRFWFFFISALLKASICLQLFVEEIARDVQAADPEWRIILLRYFNPVGAHPSGLIGEDPRGVPNNLMPFLQQVAVGRRAELTVFGQDYPTKDGTGVCELNSSLFNWKSACECSSFGFFLCHMMSEMLPKRRGDGEVREE